MTALFNNRSIDETIADLTLEEKAALLTGRGMWRTAEVARLGIPSILMTDGTYGVRYSIDQIDEGEGDLDLAAFLEIVNQSAREGDLVFGRSKPATCFPNGSCLGCSWDLDLAYEMGTALASECQAFNVHLLLGPGINIRRTPLAGRAYEYYSEDPILTGDLAAAVISGLQDHGVGAALKHFAANNSEVERTTMDSVVDERALREIYLLGFERAISKARPWTVMSSYNVLNGVQASQNPWLLTGVLRDEWGFDGLVVSDWHGIKDRTAALEAGNDLDMPEAPARHGELLEAIRSGSVAPRTLDRAVARLLTLVRRAHEGARPGAMADLDAHHALARRVAADSIVLLENDGVLPLRAGSGEKVVVIGKAAAQPVIQGSGSATTNPHRVDIPLDAVRMLAGADVPFLAGYDENPDTAGQLAAEAIAAAAKADVVLFFASTTVGQDGEGADRKSLDLGNGQDALIAELARSGAKVVVILAIPDAVVMPWRHEVNAIVATFFGGQGMGQALADILYGRINPSGKLSVSFPAHLEDVPGFLSYPGENSRHLYAEGIYVGYRGYQKRRTNPAFPFGFGLSYTSFAYGDLTASTALVGIEDDVTLSVPVTNTGDRAGKEIVQFYLAPQASRLARPVRELKAYAKLHIEPGETRTVTVTIPNRDLRYYDPAYGEWVLDGGTITLEAAASSHDIRSVVDIEIAGDAARYRKIGLDTQPKFILENPRARAAFVEFFQDLFAVSREDAEKMLEYTSTSFFGIFTTINYFFKQKIDPARMDEVIRKSNSA